MASQNSNLILEASQDDYSLKWSILLPCAPSWWGSPGYPTGTSPIIVLINYVGFEDQHNDVGEIITCKRRLREVNKIHLKYVDDLLIAESINLNQQLITVPPQERDLPDQFHARTGHQLPEVKSEVHCQLLKTVRYAEENQMQLNLKKTKLMLFNPSRTRDFMPCFSWLTAVSHFV